MARITYDSDWEMAESILVKAARKAAGEIIMAIGQEPYVRSEMYDYGVLMRLRYMTQATDRPRIVHEITKTIFTKFTEESRVDFTIPYVYSSKRVSNPLEQRLVKTGYPSNTRK